MRQAPDGAAGWEIGSVLVVEDDERSGTLMRATIGSVSRHVQVVGTARAALDAVMESDYDLITLDVGLPDLTGIELLHHLREVTDAPVIMVTAMGQPSAIVEGLMDGADDYIVKPIRPAELLARIRAVTRRMQPPRAALDRYADGDLEVDFKRSVVVTAAGSRTLSRTERRLLVELVSGAGEVLTYEDLLKRVWGAAYEADIANLHVYISYLRKKIDGGPSRPSRIRTHRGVGYEFVALSRAVDNFRTDEV